jgi:hypothetical protein
MKIEKTWIYTKEHILTIEMGKVDFRDMKVTQNKIDRIRLSILQNKP